VTGAPKIRAMEIIAEIEPVARGPYCGALGYLGFGGDMDTSVSIRIAVAKDDRVVFHAGGAVVADSDPAAEYVETLDKARALMSAVGEGDR
jgi:para-aminobenzoate synthetase component 1